MITQKPISGVVFETPFAELRSALIKLSSCIDYWFAIEHLPEGNEGKKLHCHFFLVPKGRIDTTRIREIIGSHCLPLRSSKEGDWFLYSLHDRGYLINHCLTKEREYTLEEMQTSLPNPRQALAGIYNQAQEGMEGLYNRINSVKSMASKGLDWAVVLSSGVIPPNQFQFYKELYSQFYSSRL